MAVGLIFSFCGNPLQDLYTCTCDLSAHLKHFQCVQAATCICVLFLIPVLSDVMAAMRAVSSDVMGVVIARRKGCWHQLLIMVIGCAWVCINNHEDLITY